MPLELDVLGMLMELATKDPSIQVRRVATANLVLQPPSRRAAKALREMIRNETDEKLIRRARPPPHGSGLTGIRPPVHGGLVPGIGCGATGSGDTARGSEARGRS